MSKPVDDLERICRHCGAIDTRHLGMCHVCGLAVCEHCGNTQHVKGTRLVTHNLCVTKGDHGFTMIKFVK
jgi:hypothetical protein